MAMSTPRDLLAVAMGPEVAGRPPQAGDLSLVLAGAELIDLLAARAVRLDGGSIVPGYRPTIADALLDEAASSLVRQEPYEAVDDWLWRRGRGLAPAYLAALQAEGQPARPRHRWARGRTGHPAPADAPDHRRATDRWTAHEPVLVALAAAAGITGGRTGDLPGVADDDVEVVLAAVNDAVMELEAVRQRRAVEQEAFDNIWRGVGG
jgi:hypothetical protein